MFLPGSPRLRIRWASTSKLPFLAIEMAARPATIHPALAEDPVAPRDLVVNDSEEEFGDLNRVECGTLAKIVIADEHRKSSVRVE